MGSPPFNLSERPPGCELVETFATSLNAFMTSPIIESKTLIISSELETMHEPSGRIWQVSYGLVDPRVPFVAVRFKDFSGH